MGDGSWGKAEGKEHNCPRERSEYQLKAALRLIVRHGQSTKSQKIQILGRYLFSSVERWRRGDALFTPFAVKSPQPKAHSSQVMLLAACLAGISPAYAQAAAEAELLLNVTDPTGDALGGGGTAALPTRPAITEEMLDITGFAAYAVRAGTGTQLLQLRTDFAQLGDPWGAPLGFSAQTLDIFIKSTSGGNTVLTGLNLQTKEGGWNYHIRVTGYGAALTVAEGAASDENNSAPTATARREGTAVVVDTNLPAGEYMYWVTSSVFSPFSPDGLLLPNANGGNFALSTANKDLSAPVPLDLLVPDSTEGTTASAAERSTRMFTLGRMEAVGELPRPEPWWLAALGAGGLVLALVCSAVLWQWRE